MSGAHEAYVHTWRPSPTGSGRTLLLLHGTGGDEHDLVPLAQRLDPDAGLLSLRGDVSEGGAARFFRRHAEGVFDLDDLAARTRNLARFVEAASRRYGFAQDRLVAVGFSNGANIAASLLFTDPPRLGGAVLFRAMLPYAPLPPPALAGKRVLVLAGARDPYGATTGALVKTLREGGARVDLHVEDAGHELAPGDVDAARRWLQEAAP